LAEYARRLVPELAQFYQLDGRIRVCVDGDSSALEIQRAVTYGILLNELVSNACKHAFPAGRPGSLTVRVRQADRQIELSVSDDGVGLPQGFDIDNGNTLGLRLVRMLASQLGGSVRLAGDGGTAAYVVFPQAPVEESG
jgi:two-component system, sensor histidine kinase PdtaS